MQRGGANAGRVRADVVRVVARGRSVGVEVDIAEQEFAAGSSRGRALRHPLEEHGCDIGRRANLVADEPTRVDCRAERECQPMDGRT